MDEPPVIDARGHRCPIPSLRLRKALEGMAEGERVTLLADDPMARIDVPHLLGQLGSVLVEARDEGRAVAFTVEKRVPVRAG
ncbi:MAG TPA: sulfurtransferase TusA family protein [Caulobacteraceae bacterium]|jgi:tRNA 2-thiouridine synthesizing protein A